MATRSGSGREGTRVAQPEHALEVDYSEVEGRTYGCIDNCALCCLCQPELLPDEERSFRQDPVRREGVADRHISQEVTGAAIKLRGAHGSCYFLRDRRCQIYDSRPHFCRSFPINVFVGWRVQPNANLSCRGVGLPGEDLKVLSESILRGLGERKLSDEAREAGKVFADFVRNTRATWGAQSFSSVRAAARALEDDFVDELGLSRILTYAEHGRTRQNAPPADIAKLARRAEPEADVTARALIDGTELFDLPDLSLLPIYIDDKLTWRIFKLVGNEILGYVLSEDGSTSESSRTDPADVDLLPFTPSGKEAFRAYMRTVNSRDCFLGHAAYLCDTDGYEYNFAQVYLGAIANNALDLWWRSSFLALLAGKEQLGAEEVREGVVFFDMDLLDLPTIGAFI